MAEAIDVVPAGTRGSTLEQQLPAIPEGPMKGRTRQRFLRGMQRISSSPTLSGLRRSKSVGSPYSMRSSLSCVSLTSSGSSSQSSSSARSTTPQPSPFSLASPPSSLYASPLSEYPFEDVSSDGTEVELVIRKVNHTTSPIVTTIAVPPELKSSKYYESQSRTRASSKAAAKPLVRLWDSLPQEVLVYIFSFLHPKELVRASIVSKSFYALCFDGQLWKSLDASEFYQDIPAPSLANIISAAGPFIRDLNLRGCVQVEHYKRTEVIVKSCKNLMNATLEGCRNFQKSTLHNLLNTNAGLVNLNLAGLAAFTNTSCKIIAESCPQLESLNVSWCPKVEAKGLKLIIDACSKLKDLRAGEVRGFHDLEAAESIFNQNGLERLVLCGCAELNDESLRIMMHGSDPEVDILTGCPIVPPRKLRHLDLSRCTRLTNSGVKAIGYMVPELEGLQLSGCKSLTDAALEPILASTPRLTHLELEDLENITDTLLSEHLAKAPCAESLEHISLSYCESIGDPGMLPVMQNCVRLQSLDLDNTRITDSVLAAAASMVEKRSTRSKHPSFRPIVTLRLAVYDCQNVNWTGIRDILFHNAELRTTKDSVCGRTYPSEVIGLKCFYGYQMTVDEHQKRVLRGDFTGASRLEKKWVDYMQANVEAGTTGSGHRRRRRRAREAQALHLHEEDGGMVGRRRARTLGSCSVM